MLRLPGFDRAFEMVTDASEVGIGGVLLPAGHSMVFYSAKLFDANKRYSTYDLDLYTMVQILKYWRHCLISKECIIYLDHKALKHFS